MTEISLNATIRQKYVKCILVALYLLTFVAVVVRTLRNL
jgi:hypothetical protein